MTAGGWFVQKADRGGPVTAHFRIVPVSLAKVLIISRDWRVMMDRIGKILEDLERQDLYQIVKHGLPEEVESGIGVLCAEYRNARPETQRTMKSQSLEKQRQ
jgi:hypothetical protein